MSTGPVISISAIFRRVGRWLARQRLSTVGGGTGHLARQPTSTELSRSIIDLRDLFQVEQNFSERHDQLAPRQISVARQVGRNIPPNRIKEQRIGSDSAASAEGGPKLAGLKIGFVLQNHNLPVS